MPGKYICAALMGIAAAQARADVADELADLSLEQLSNVIVTSVSRQQERLSDAAASVYIIAAADIRRSGARSIPEALRLAPNLQVARVDARNYAITARGFNSAFENKLLVLIDGRSVYSPLFSGVYWDAQDVVMEDIDRIEVISGPGATIWGANAVNGVINVITKSARDTEGGLASATAGADQREGVLRYGGKLGEEGRFRVYGKSAQEDDTATEDGRASFTGWRRSQAGFRADWASGATALTASGNVYQGALRQPGTVDIRIGGANLLGSATHQLDGGSTLRVQAILDHTERDQPLAFREHLDTLELEVQHGIRLGERHNLVWGAGYRYSWDSVVNDANFGFLPGNLNMHWGNVFAQDEITLLPSLKLTAGLKLASDTYTGSEYLPSLRLAWTTAPDALLWGSLTRSVRTPSRIDRDFYAPSQPLIIDGKPFFVIGGGPDFQSEVAKTAELGYRAQPLPQWSYSVTAYYSEYSKLRTLEPQSSGTSVFGNMGRGTVRGVEMWSVWQPQPGWRLHAGLVLQDVDTRIEPGSRDATAASGLATNDPSHHWLLRSSVDLSERWMLDLHLRHSAGLPQPAVAAYSELDAQLLWKPRPDIDVALLGQNLLHRSHVEFGGGAGRSVLERAVLLKLTKRF